MNENKVIAIGALGGSGTRAVAKVIMESGVFLGRDLNLPNDNMVFARFFRNPDFYRQSDKEAVFERLSIFSKYMENGARLPFNELNELVDIAKTNTRVGIPKLYKLRAQLDNLFGEKYSFSHWGWKEPNTQIYIPYLAEFFPNMKYIQVLRHGLDMAFSRNKVQLRNWGYLFDIEYKEGLSDKDLSIMQLDYWIRINEKSIEEGRKYFGDNFFLLNHTSFGENPKQEVQNILNFIDMDISKEKQLELMKIPKVSSSNNRYLSNDISHFRDDQLRAVEELGFKINK